MKEKNIEGASIYYVVGAFNFDSKLEELDLGKLNQEREPSFDLYLYIYNTKIQKSVWILIQIISLFFEVQYFSGFRFIYHLAQF